MSESDNAPKNGDKANGEGDAEHVASDPAREAGSEAAPEGTPEAAPEADNDDTESAPDGSGEAPAAAPDVGAGTPLPPRWLRVVGHSGIAQLLLVIVMLAAFLPGFWTVPPLDRDEPRFAKASKQMLETGNYSDIRFQQEVHYKKPVGIYWLQAAAAKVTGYDAEAPICVYWLSSIAGAILAVLLTFWAARAFTGSPQALVAALFVALALVVGVEARLAKTDAMLLATIVASQGALARIWLSGKPKQPLSLVLTFWIALGLGILIKGRLRRWSSG
ncbi:phospholipid carrier-dependent glycosyltransferase [Breoghania sp.]|uniref:ArnT family glycosyltransferase n=1 Tax=Breoghania sp. TaxID=2065378 RepID=UPI0026259D51|nr:phospholipid carrier-dependent glycosyltransferase [Breoghania sp.]MDJ0929550.1 glycosyltransferase family 39 protein [Breoghania sp.]